MNADANIKVDMVERKIGSILKSSEYEQDDTSDNIPNYYPKGINLYKIPNVVINKAITIEVEENKCIK
jgi:hypothetical protein